MGFIQEVRKGAVSHPAQPKYSREAWTSALAVHGTGEPQEQRLHDSGLFMDQCFCAIRSELTRTPDRPFPPHSQLRTRLAFLNAMVRASQDHLVAVATGQAPGYPLGDTIPTVAGIPGVRDLEGLVDAGRFMLADAPPSKEPGGRALVSASALLSKRIELARAYNLLEYIWLLCLWQDWYWDLKGESPVLRPRSMDGFLARECAGLREGELESQLGSMSFVVWKTLPAERRAQVLSRVHVADVRITSGAARFSVSTVRTDTGAPPTEFTATLAVMEQHLADLLSQELPGVPGVTGYTLLNAWEAMASLAHAIQKHEPRAGRCESAVQVECWTPLVRHGDLVDLVRQATEAPEPSARIIVDRMIFQVAARGDLWVTPLVRIRKGHLGLVPAALAGANLIRNIEKSWSGLGLDLDVRGGAFEASLRTEIESKKLLEAFQVHPTSLWIDLGGNLEEIDLLLRIGSVVAVGEAKCTIRPTSPLEWHRTEQLVAGAAAQADRKAGCVRNNWSAIAEACGWDLSPPSDVVPFVVTNQPGVSGEEVGGVPVVDHLILKRFFCDGHVESMATFSPDGTYTATRTKLYDSADEASRRLREYLREPPQVQLFEGRVALVEHELPLAALGRKLMAVQPLLRLPRSAGA